MPFGRPCSSAAEPRDFNWRSSGRPTPSLGFVPPCDRHSTRRQAQHRQSQVPLTRISQATTQMACSNRTVHSEPKPSNTRDARMMESTQGSRVSDPSSSMPVYQEPVNASSTMNTPVSTSTRSCRHVSVNPSSAPHRQGDSSHIYQLVTRVLIGMARSGRQSRGEGLSQATSRSNLGPVDASPATQATRLIGHIIQDAVDAARAGAPTEEHRKNLEVLLVVIETPIDGARLDEDSLRALRQVLVTTAERLQGQDAGVQAFLELMLWQGPPPATESSIAALPARHWTPSDSECCVVCYNNFSSEDLLMTMPCGHCDFHQACLHQWLQRHRSCPLCRAHLNP